MHRIGYVLSEGFQVMAISTQAVFEFANLVAEDAFYAIENYSSTGGEVRASMGLSLNTRPLTARSSADTWLVAGVIDPLNVEPAREVLRFLKKVGPRTRRIAGL